MIESVAKPGDTCCRRFIVRGRVQGVWFRDSTRRQAQQLGLDGFAKNLPDGTVEVVARGDRDAIDTLALWLQQGPRHAVVSGVEEIEAGTATEESYTGFSVL